MRLLAIAGVFALAVPTMAAAEGPNHGKGGPPHGGGHPMNRAVAPHGGGPGFHAHVGGPGFHAHVGGPGIGAHAGPVHAGFGAHAAWMFHGHSYAWHAVGYPHPWAYPAGYGYRLWAVGAVLPPLFWSTPTYYYTGWAGMGLPPPDPGFQYVEYGPDLLLVNVADGSVVQVFPGAFS